MSVEISSSLGPRHTVEVYREQLKGVIDGNGEVECTVIWAVIVRFTRVYRSTHSMYRDAVTDGLKTYSRSDHQLKDIRDNQSVGDVDQQEECTVIRMSVMRMLDISFHSSRQPDIGISGNARYLIAEYLISVNIGKDMNVVDQQHILIDIQCRFKTRSHYIMRYLISIEYVNLKHG
ncbi:hypothetical protein BDB01DRAFT_840157 [Pilobolus umbonatus]|nr:hypothetical protein BDB01DRAFT_840157 [Pilobolus umbonatus]